MSFRSIFEKLDLARLSAQIKNATAVDVERALAKETVEPSDFAALFSPAADPYLERMAQKSAAVTERRFGKTIQLYVPLYLSNECVNHCLYCGFSKQIPIKRTTLPIERVAAEADVLYEEGFRHILLVCGESPRHVGYHYLTEAIRRLHEKFDSIGLEIYPLDRDGYERMGDAGADGLTLYQETYDPALYKTLHPKGPKRDFWGRLDSHDRAGQAGYRSLGIGALLGLADWRKEAVILALHGRHLTRSYWRSRVAVSFPRLRFAPGDFSAPHEVSDRNVVNMLCALRLILPDAEMVFSTREDPEFRDNLIGLGVTRMSAGSRTNPGGYKNPEGAGEQFRVSDNRTAAQVAKVIFSKGCEPVWKDFDKTFLTSD